MCHQCGYVVFPSIWELTNDIILNMGSKTMEHHILPSLAKVTTVTTTFDLWMFCGYLYTSCQLHRQKMGPMSYHYGNFWGSWNNMGYHDSTIKGLACSVWFIEQSYSLSERWRCQWLDKHYVLCSTCVTLTICYHFIWPSHV